MSRRAFVYCTAALVLFAFLSYSAILTKSATFDEPAHVCSSYVALHDGDFSVEPDHPPLWKYVAAFPLLFTSVDAHADSPVFHDIPSHVESEFPWAVATLYQTPGNDTRYILSSARFMMLVLAVSLGVVIAFFAHRLAGPLAACIATTLFALDPNFLAHASLVKNDVALALAYAALSYALYLLTERLTLPRLGACALCAAACLTTKLTGILAAPVVVLTLLTRALEGTPWLTGFTRMGTGNRELGTRRRRLLAATALVLFCALFSYAGIWAVYRFRFNPSPDPAVHYDTTQFLDRAAKGDLLATLHRDTATAAEFAAWKPDAMLRLGLRALEFHVLPEAYLNGLIFAHAASRSRPSFFLGSISTTPHLAYFPVAFLVKTPLATLVLLFAAALLPLIQRGTGNKERGTPLGSFIVLLPVVLYLLPTLLGGINIGIRHLLPVYPLLYIAASIPLSRFYHARPKFLRPIFLLATVALLVETVTAYPDYIPFFNLAAGGYRGGLHLLGDSNLDWGQDLPLLADWQKHNPARTLHLAYFGLADPAYYGIRYVNLPHGYRFGPEPSSPSLPTTGVLAISASDLQGIEFPRPNDNPYTPLLHRQPTQILGGSLYLYDLGGD